MIAWLLKRFRRKPIPQPPPPVPPVQKPEPVQPVRIRLETQVIFERGRVKTQRVPVDA